VAVYIVYCSVIETVLLSMFGVDNFYHRRCIKEIVLY